ncbi:rasGAP-activating-like protein 1 isoform X2 [Bombina bombina]|uniref:rasGAP-activating-like protein 1 isoform X2 n=1 Tax=Bombina bombina TaxID=8345 RepID=UPI00235A72DE|nr:rasGAP-activating-like protein 1 isoform X2 [Bombina bombina]
MARNTALYFRLVEGKNLPAKDVSGTSDPYCIVKVDNEAVARTATVWRDLNPFWGEEFTLHLPLGFHTLSFYVMDEDTIGHDDVIGKISLTKEYIASQPRGIDSWINLSCVDPDEEVQGEIYLELHIMQDQHRSTLHCHVLEARDLAPRDISGTSDPFVRIFCNNQTSETMVIKRTRFPRWNEVLEFDLRGIEELDPVDQIISIEVWDWDMVGKNDFLGRVWFPLEPLQKSPAITGWFRLLPFGNSEEENGGKLGSLRVKVNLSEERILPSVYYQTLIQLLVESIQSPDQGDSSLLSLLEEICSAESRQEVAVKLVKIFLGQGLAVTFLDKLNMREVNWTGDPNTLFRSNSLASKSMEQYMKIVGMPYLHEVLRPIITRIFEEKRYVELDPCKIDLNRGRRISFKSSVSEQQVRESSLESLKGYLGDIMDAILGSVEQCPPGMRLCFKQLHKRVEERFPGPSNQDVKYAAISGFLFLRFFAPAILTPKLFHLQEHHADPRTARTLLLLAKSVQSIGNLGQQLGYGKEQWMSPLHPLIQQSVGKLRDFLDRLIDMESEAECGQLSRTLFHPSVTIKEGFLHKRKAEAVNLVTRFTFKKRYFWLSSQTLSYSKSPDWQVRATIPVHRICAVERVDENAFQQPNMMQIISQDSEPQGGHIMYIQCKNVNELNQWLSALRKVSLCNQRLLQTYHPGAYRNSHWTCCLQSDRTVRGCSRTHLAVTLGDWSDPLDPDAEAQVLYRHLLLAKDVLRNKFLEDAESGSSGKSDVRSHNQKSAEGPVSSPLKRLLSAMEDLERTHQTFERKEREETPNHSHCT